MYERIAVLADGSEASRKAAKESIRLARLSGGSILAVYVADATRLAHLAGCGEFLDAVRRDLFMAGEQATKDIEKLANEAGVPCEKLVLDGDPKKELQRISKEAEMGLLVVGRTRQGRLKGLLFGCSSEKAAHRVDVPVLMIHGDSA